MIQQITRLNYECSRRKYQTYYRLQSDFSRVYPLWLPHQRHIMITGVFSTTLSTEGSHNRGREAHPRLELTPQKVLCPPMDMAPDITKVVVSYPVIHYPLQLRAPLFWTNLCYCLAQFPLKHHYSRGVGSALPVLRLQSLLSRVFYQRLGGCGTNTIIRLRVVVLLFQRCKISSAEVPYNYANQRRERGEITLDPTRTTEVDEERDCQQYRLLFSLSKTK